jgi:uncharacterized membrane protein AbrB (regulator of aidB expression)
MSAVVELRMPKALSLAGLIVSVILLLVFGADLAMPKGMQPFGQPSFAMDLGFVICSALLGYMSWSTYRELG